MTDDIDEMGPIDWVVIDLPPGGRKIEGEMANELSSLADAELIRVLDLMLVVRDDDGELDVIEFEDLEGAGPLAAFEGALAEILAYEDVEAVAEDLEPGGAAAVIVWENTWAAPFATAARRAGGQLVASGRIPTQAILAALAADEGGN